MGAIVLFVGAIVGLKRGASRTAMTGTFGLAAVALIAGGAYAGLNGERETHPHHTPGDIAEENECGAEETEADDLASQSVAAKANVAAELTFDGSQLTYDLPGYDGKSAGLTVPRSTPTNIMFHNDGDDDARLVIEMHPRLDDDGNPTRPRADLHAARRAGLDAVPHARVRAAELGRRGRVRVHRARHRRHPPGGRAMSAIPTRRHGPSPCPNVPPRSQAPALRRPRRRRSSACWRSSSCAKDAPQDTWKPAGTNAQTIQDLQWWVFLIAGIVGVIVFAAVLYVRDPVQGPRPADPRAVARQRR